jgi:hypothetical protein
MHEAIGEAILLNSFFFQNSLVSPIKLLMKLFSKKNSFTNEAEPVADPPGGWVGCSPP